MPTTASPEYPNIPEKENSDLKSYLMMVVEDFNKSIKNSLKEIQENTAKQVEDLKKETQKPLKELQENTTMQVMKLNKTIQVSISNRIQEMEERISGAEGSIENMDATNASLGYYTQQKSQLP
jgi:mRNA-degrading endonuclease RelE of RelBE toxin-antitoxin system